MPLPYVYADFNAIEYPSDQSLAEMPLTGLGTLASLAMQRIRLTEGMALVLFEPEDIECEVTVHFDTARADPAGRQGEWIARFDHRLVRDTSRAGLTVPNEYPCIVCGQSFFGPALGRNYTAICRNCGASVMEPMLPPGCAQHRTFRGVPDAKEPVRDSGKSGDAMDSKTCKCLHDDGRTPSR